MWSLGGLLAVVGVALFFVSRAAKEKAAAEEQQVEVMRHFLTAFYGADWDGLMGCCHSLTHANLEALRQTRGNSVFPVPTMWSPTGKSTFIPGSKFRVEQFEGRNTGYDSLGVARVECSFMVVTVTPSAQGHSMSGLQAYLSKEGGEWKVRELGALDVAEWLAG